MTNDTWLRIGLIGTALMTVCCFTPFLAILFSALGQAALLSYLDNVLLPLLLGFLLISVIALWRRQRAQ